MKTKTASMKRDCVYFPHPRMSHSIVLIGFVQVLGIIRRPKKHQVFLLWGKLHLLNFYGEGGYPAELGCDKTTALKVISELNLFNWTDRFTSAVIAKFTVFNSQVNCSV